MIDNLQSCIDALLNGWAVRVTTATRMFEGHVFEVGRSPYHNDFSCRVVDDEGRVHYFRPERDDCRVVDDEGRCLPKGSGSG